MTKAIVIGGGIGGLTAAAALGRAGVEVAVIQMEHLLLCRLRGAVAKRASARARLRQYEKIARFRV